MSSPPRSLIPALSLTLIVGYGSMFYAFAVLSHPIQKELGWSAEFTVGAYSLALLLSGIGALPVGRIIDRCGGREMLALGSLLAGASFLILSRTHSAAIYYVLWLGIGAAMAMTLYEPAFAVVVAVYPRDFRSRIGLLTLAGGFASTIFWPLTHALEVYFGWRTAAAVLGAINLAVCLPLHWLVVPRTPSSGPADDSMATPGGRLTPSLRKILRMPTFWLITTSFTASGFVMAAMAVYAIPLLQSHRLEPAAAVALAAFIGPMQVLARLIEMTFNRRLTISALGAVTVALMPAGLVALLIPSSQTLAFVYVFLVAYGAGLGLVTIVRAAAPPQFFGPSQYASISGLLAVPAVAARAVGPYAAATVLTAFGTYTAVLTLLIGIGLTGAMCYWIALALRRRERLEALRAD